jgi:ADP-ribose pyrophosphatase YjhB (NUDIX family)
MESGEDILAALHREIQEETGLHVAVERLIGVYSDPAYQIVEYVDRPDRGRTQFVTTVFRCRVVGGSFVGSDEGLAWAWFASDALPPDLTAYARVWLADALANAPEVRIREWSGVRRGVSMTPPRPRTGAGAGGEGYVNAVRSGD